MASPIAIAQHRLDFDGQDVGIGADQDLRRIKNWVGYQTPAGVWAQQDQQVEQGLGTPPGWIGSFEFTYQARNSACQVWVHENGAAPLYGIRRSENHAHWLNTQIVGGDSSDHAVYAAQKAIKYSAVFDGMDLWWQLRPDGVAQVLEEIDSGIAPSSWRQVYKMPAATQIVRVGDAFSLRDGQGVERLHIRAPVGWDEGPTGDGNRRGPGFDSIPIPIAVDVISTWTDSGYRYALVEFTPDAAAKAQAVGRKYYDPTETISGSTDCKDTMIINAGDKDRNWGAHADAHIASTVRRSSFFRINSAQIPAGYTAFTWFFWRQSAGGAQASGTANVHLSLNYSWVAGTADGASQTGSPSWNNKAHPSTAWAGGAGAESSGTDYDATVEASWGYDAYTAGNDVPYEEALTTAMLDDFLINDGGWQVRASGSNTNDIFHLLAQENPDNQWYVEIPYSSSNAAIVHYYRHMVGGQA